MFLGHIPLFYNLKKDTVRNNIETYQTEVSETCDSYHRETHEELGRSSSMQDEKTYQKLRERNRNGSMNFVIRYLRAKSLN